MAKDRILENVRFGGRVIGVGQGYGEGAGDRKADAGWCGVKLLLKRSRSRRELHKEGDQQGPLLQIAGGLANCRAALMSAVGKVISQRHVNQWESTPPAKVLTAKGKRQVVCMSRRSSVEGRGGWI